MDSKTTTIYVASVPEHVFVDLQTDLQELFPDAKVSTAFQASVESPAWVEIVADVSTWSSVFKVAVGVYLTTLAKHAADATWENKSELYSAILAHASQGLDVLRRLYGALHKAQSSIDRNLGFRVTLPDHSDRQIELAFAVSSEGEFLEQFSRFVDNVEKIADAALRIMNEGHPILNDFRCTCTDDGGFVLRWQHKTTYQAMACGFDSSGAEVHGIGPEI